MNLPNNMTLIVSGFPRSGTSMMMRMLKFGGIDVLADAKYEESTNDGDPYGALELGDVGVQIKEHDIEWTQNKAVKIVTPYIRWLPLDRPLKCIFMQRELADIIVSLFAQRTIWGEDIPTSIATARAYLEQHKIPTLFLKYKDVVKYPKTAAREIEEFVGVPLDIQEMTKAVDPDARHRKSDDPTVPKTRQQGLIRVDKERFADLKVGIYRQPEELLGDKNVPGSNTASRPDVPEKAEGI